MQIPIKRLDSVVGLYWYTKGFNIGYIIIDIIGVILYYWFTSLNLLASSVGPMFPMMFIVGVLTYIWGKYELKKGKIVLLGKDRIKL